MHNIYIMILSFVFHQYLSMSKHKLCNYYMLSTYKICCFFIHSNHSQSDNLSRLPEANDLRHMWHNMADTVVSAMLCHIQIGLKKEGFAV